MLTNENRLITRHASQLISDGFVGNGCGAGMVSKAACFALSKWFGVEIKKSWDIHDSEYSIPFVYKSKSHRKEADANLHTNLMSELNIDEATPHNDKRLRFIALVHAGLVLKGDIAYWKLKRGEGLSYTKVVVVASTVSGVFKYFL